MLNPTSAFEYVFQGASKPDEAAWVELAVVLGEGIVDGDGD